MLETTLISLATGWLTFLVIDQRRRLRALENSLNHQHKAILWLVVACKQAGVGMQSMLAIQQELQKFVDQDGGKDGGKKGKRSTTTPVH